MRSDGISGPMYRNIEALRERQCCMTDGEPASRLQDRTATVSGEPLLHAWQLGKSSNDVTLLS